MPCTRELRASASRDTLPRSRGLLIAVCDLRVRYRLLRSSNAFKSDARAILLRMTVHVTSKFLLFIARFIPEIRAFDLSLMRRADLEVMSRPFLRAHTARTYGNIPCMHECLRVCMCVHNSVSLSFHKSLTDACLERKSEETYSHCFLHVPEATLKK